MVLIHTIHFQDFLVINYDASIILKNIDSDYLNNLQTLLNKVSLDMQIFNMMRVIHFISIALRQ